MYPNIQFRDARRPHCPWRIAVPVDGSRAAQCAVHHVVNRAKRGGRIEVTVVGLAPLFLRALPRAVSAAGVAASAAALGRTRDARGLLGTHHIPYRLEAATGDPAEAVVGIARAHDCDEIVMGPIDSPFPLAGQRAGLPERIAYLAQCRVTLVRRRPTRRSL